MPGNMLGKAFEYACVKAVYELYSKRQHVEIVESEPLVTARKYFDTAADKRDDLLAGAMAAARVLDRLEPRLSEAEGTLFLEIQADKVGQTGDVRDVLCVRHGDEWEIGLSCKHNHAAVKHSRLSGSIDFGRKWLGVPCSATYFNEVRPVFSELAELHEVGRKRGKPVFFKDLPNKVERFYVPVLAAFIKELTRINSENDGIPEKLIRYLVGEYDFYKIITDDRRRLTKVEAVNIDGTLNRRSGTQRAITSVSVMKPPSEIFAIRMKKGSHTTVEVICDNAWAMTMRIHSAKKEVEPSLKFDVNLTGTPGGFYLEMEPWDS